MCGKDHPCWKGGITYNPYCAVWRDEDYKRDIFERDNYKCQNPTCSKISKRLSRHHIDYDKEKCSPNNLITLCNSCNSVANRDRRWHKAWYQAIMAKKYGYRYEKT